MPNPDVPKFTIDRPGRFNPSESHMPMYLQLKDTTSWVVDETVANFCGSCPVHGPSGVVYCSGFDVHGEAELRVGLSDIVSPMVVNTLLEDAGPSCQVRLPDYSGVVYK